MRCPLESSGVHVRVITSTPSAETVPLCSATFSLSASAPSAVSSPGTKNLTRGSAMRCALGRGAPRSCESDTGAHRDARRARSIGEEAKGFVCMVAGLE
eukprot:2213398-Pleurochrysis_carterae.AAC.3